MKVLLVVGLCICNTMLAWGGDGSDDTIDPWTTYDVAPTSYSNEAILGEASPNLFNDETGVGSSDRSRAGIYDYVGATGSSDTRNNGRLLIGLESANELMQMRLIAWEAQQLPMRRALPAF
jgi:hypothetical protein